MRDAAIRVLFAFDYDLGWGRTSYEQKWANQRGMEFKLIEFVVGRIAELAARNSTPIFVVFYPDVGFLAPDSPYVAIYDSAARTLEGRLGVPSYSGYEAILSSGDASESMAWSVTDKHPTREAHRIFASWPYSKVANSGSVPMGASTSR